MTVKNELNWMANARQHIGVSEIVGSKHNPILLGWLKDMGKYGKESKAWWADDETPWCGLFVGHVLGTSDRFVVPHWFRAGAWADSSNMTKLAKPAYGCIVTFTRKGGGHVGFVVGKDKAGNLLVLGGNQGNRVSIAAFAPSRATGYYWPSIWDGKQALKSQPAPYRYDLPLGTAVVSKSEA